MSLLITLMLGQAGLAACADPQTQMQMNACSQADFVAADAELNAQWALTVAEMRRIDQATRPHRDGRAGYYDQLLAAQRRWIQFRDAHCASEGYEARGGSLEPMLVSGCKATLTRLRTAQLRELAD